MKFKLRYHPSRAIRRTVARDKCKRHRSATQRKQYIHVIGQRPGSICHVTHMGVIDTTARTVVRQGICSNNLTNIVIFVFLRDSGSKLHWLSESAR